MPSKRFTRHSRAFLKCPYCFRLQAFLTASTAVILHWYKTCTKCRGVAVTAWPLLAALLMHLFAFLPENFYANIKKTPNFLLKVL